MTSPDRPRLAVRSPADLIAAVPYLLGFHPADSVVVVALRGRRIIFAARADLPPSGTDPGLSARHLAGVVERQRAEAATVIGYGPAARVTATVDAVGEALDAAGLRLLDALRVADGRYWSYLCTEPDCCPPEGRPYDQAGSEVSAAAVFAGQVALPDRAALVGQVAPLDGPVRVAMRKAVARAERRLAQLLRSIGHAGPPQQTGHDGPALAGEHARHSRPAPRDRPDRGWAARASGRGRDATPPAGPGRAVGSRRDSGETPVDRVLRTAGRAAVRVALRRSRRGERLTDDEVAWLALLLNHLAVRDHAWARTDGRDADLSLWADVLRRVEDELAPAPACLLAFAAWRQGLGALAAVALERALAARPEYGLALLLDDVLRRGVPPSELDGWPAVGEPGVVRRRRRRGGP